MVTVILITITNHDMSIWINKSFYYHNWFVCLGVLMPALANHNVYLGYARLAAQTFGQHKNEILKMFYFLALK